MIVGDRYCRLKGFFLRKEEKGNTIVGTELHGTWFSGTQTLGVVTDLIEYEKCELSIVNPKGTIDRIYRYRFVRTKSWETTVELDMIQNYGFHILNLIHPQIIHAAIYRLIRGILPYDLYTDLKKFLPNTLLDSIAKDAFPAYVEKK